MPNGGMHHCAHCSRFVNSDGRCSLRNVTIDHPYWTTCRNWNVIDGGPTGPLYAIVCEVRRRAGAYTEIPYFDGKRADTIQANGDGDTVVRFRDLEGREHEFATVADYLDFYRQSDREL